MEKPFFIMIFLASPTPMVEGDDDLEEVAFFATEEEARECAKTNGACQSFGYEIFELGTGET